MAKGNRLHKLLPHFFFWVVVLIFAAALAVLKWRIYCQHGYQSDVFSYSRAIANTLDGRFMWDPVHTYLLGSHSYLLLLLFVPIYALLPSPFILISSSVLSHVLAMWFVVRLSQVLFASVWIGFFWGAFYFLNPFILEQVVMPVYGFQPDIWAAPFIFATCYYFALGRMWATLFSLALLAAVKEEFALLGVGLVALLGCNHVYPWLSPKLNLFSHRAKSVLEKGSRPQIFPLGAGAVVFMALSFAVLQHGKSIKEHHFPPPVLE